MKKQMQRGFTLIELLVVITIIAILASLAVPTYNTIQDKSNQVRATSNCRQIISALKLYAGDNSGAYPDSDPSQPTTANDAFRLLIKQDIIQDERIFGCPASKFNGDNNIGTAPEYAEAVESNENHWAMTVGQTESSSSVMPLVFENPATQAWPPQWNADYAGQLQPGRTWRGGKIVIGLNDNSVSVVKLEATKGMVGPADLGSGTNLFTQAAENQEILNILTN